MCAVQVSAIFIRKSGCNMCRCTPEIRTPWCGKPGCETPVTAQPMKVLPGNYSLRNIRQPDRPTNTNQHVPIYKWHLFTPVGLEINFPMGDERAQHLFDAVDGQAHEFPLRCIVETTGESSYFKGTVIGHYTTSAGHTGCVIECLPSNSCRQIVHVNRDKHLRRVA